MVTRSLDINFVGEYLTRHLRGDAEASGGIFDISDNEIEFVFFSQWFNKMGRAWRPGLPQTSATNITLMEDMVLLSKTENQAGGVRLTP